MRQLSYARHRFPPVIIHAVWLYFRFALSYRDVEDMLAERGIDSSYETVRRWALKFGRSYADRIDPSADHGPRIAGILTRSSSRSAAGPSTCGAPWTTRARCSTSWSIEAGPENALKLLRKLLKRQGYVPDAIVTDRLRSYGATLRDLGLADRHVSGGRSNNRAEVSHQPTRRRERQQLLPDRQGRLSASSRPMPPSPITSTSNAI